MICDKAACGRLIFLKKCLYNHRSRAILIKLTIKHVSGIRALVFVGTYRGLGTGKRQMLDVFPRYGRLTEWR